MRDLGLEESPASVLLGWLVLRNALARIACVPTLPAAGTSPPPRETTRVQQWTRATPTAAIAAWHNTHTHTHTHVLIQLRRQETRAAGRPTEADADQHNGGVRIILLTHRGLWMLSPVRVYFLVGGLNVVSVGGVK